RPGTRRVDPLMSPRDQGRAPSPESDAHAGAGTDRSLVTPQLSDLRHGERPDRSTERDAARHAGPSPPGTTPGGRCARSACRCSRAPCPHQRSARVRERIKSWPALIVAMIAVVLAGAGTATAAKTLLTGKDIKDRSLT